MLGEAVTAAATDATVRDALFALGRARVAAFDADTARARLLDELAPVL